MAAETLAGIL